MKISKTVTLWIKYARTDLRVAKHNLETSTEFKAVAAFHAQQCVEKIIKAYLTHQKMRVHKTHDIEVLLEDVSKVNPTLAKKLTKAKVLTKLKPFQAYWCDYLEIFRYRIGSLLMARSINSASENPAR